MGIFSTLETTEINQICDYETMRFGVDVPVSEAGTLFSIVIFFNEKLGYSLVLSEVQALNEERYAANGDVFDVGSLNEGDTIYLRKNVKDKTKKQPKIINYDEFIFLVTVSELPNPFQISQYYGLNFTEIENLNKEIYNKQGLVFNSSNLKKGDIIYLPSGTIKTQVVTAGDTESDIVFKVAWTTDDGPKPSSEPMLGMFSKRNIPATWYIMRDTYNAYGAGNSLDLYKKIQDQGGEIALHGFHPDANHLAWFPYPPRTKASYMSITDAMNDMESFYTLLTNAGIKVKFVRPPYGLHSEMIRTLQFRGYQGDPNAEARRIIKGQTVTSQASIQVRNDLEIMKSRIDDLNLHLGITPEIRTLDWNAESSGTTLTDSVSLSYNIKSGRPDKGKFEREAKKKYNGNSAITDWVILTHDNEREGSQKSVDEAERDILQTEYYASYTKEILEGKYDPLLTSQNTVNEDLKDGIKIEYYTMSELFKKVRGIDP